MSHRVISIDSEEPLTSLFEKVSLALEILRERFVSLEASIASQKCEENELVKSLRAEIAELRGAANAHQTQTNGIEIGGQVRKEENEALKHFIPTSSESLEDSLLKLPMCTPNVVIEDENEDSTSDAPSSSVLRPLSSASSNSPVIYDYGSEPEVSDKPAIQNVEVSERTPIYVDSESDEESDEIDVSANDLSTSKVEKTSSYNDELQQAINADLDDDSFFSDDCKSQKTDTDCSDLSEDEDDDFAKAMLRPKNLNNKNETKNSVFSKKTIEPFVKPAFGSAPRQFSDLITKNASFLNKSNDAFAVDPKKFPIFSKQSSPGTSENTNLMPRIAPNVTYEEGAYVWLETRCKLYRFFNKNDTRERGVGMLKLLESPDGTLRVVMRREQVLKVCANFKITSSFKLESSAARPKIMTWCCKDFSEKTEEGEDVTLICKFDSGDTAKTFKKIIETKSQN